MTFATRGATGKGAWYIIGIFTALVGMSYFDRFILALLAAPITQEFDLSDQQMGLLLGFGFALVYSLAGLPIGYYLDRKNRIYGVVAGVFVWSLATVASGFAESYGQLLLLRAGVAVGEAVLTPAMVSLIADLFDPAKRGKPTAVYLAAGTIMSGGAFVVGGAAIDLAGLVHGLRPDWAVWRITLVIVGLPGLVLGLLTLATVREPGRREVRVPPGASASGVAGGSLVAHLRGHSDFYLPLYVCVGLGVSVGMAIFAWMPTILARSYGLQLAESGYRFGAAAIPAVVIGTVFWTWVVGRVGIGSGGPIVAMLGGVVVMLLGALLAVSAQGSTVVIVAAALMAAGAGCFTPVCALIVQQMTPSQMHARLMAIALFAANIVGAGGGPLAPSLLTGFWPGDAGALERALIAYALAISLLLLGGLLLCRRGYRRLAQARLAA